MKLRDSKPLSPKREPEKRVSNVTSVLTDRLVKANSAGCVRRQ